MTPYPPPAITLPPHDTLAHTLHLPQLATDELPEADLLSSRLACKHWASLTPERLTVWPDQACEHLRLLTPTKLATVATMTLWCSGASIESSAHLTALKVQAGGRAGQDWGHK